MANCCVNGLNQVFCNAFNKYYNTLYANGEISKEETNNLLIIDYIRQCLSDDRYSGYYNILLKALRCIANNSCLLDTSWLYNRSIVPKVTNQFVTVLTKQTFKETDPIFKASPAATITDEDINNWNNSSANNILIVRFTQNNDVITCDTSIADIYAAVSAGTEVVGLIYESTSQMWASLRVSVASSTLCVFDMQYGGAYTNLIGAIVNSTDVWQENQDLNLVTDAQVMRWNNKQDALVSGTNIKTINNSSILSRGNIDLVPTEIFNNFCPIIEDTRNSEVATITGIAPFSELVNGQRIILDLAYNTIASTTLQLTLSDGVTTRAIPIKHIYNGNFWQVNAGKSYTSNCFLELIYDYEADSWVVMGSDSNSTYTAFSQAQINAGTSTAANLASPKLIHDNAYIVEETYSSGSLKANKFYDFGTVSSALTIPSLDATNDLVSNALNFYALRFIAGADNISITFPTGVIVDDEPTINTGDYVEIMINKYGSNFYASIKVWQAQ